MMQLLILSFAWSPVLLLCRRLSSEQHDHALALWYLYKQQLKQQSKQQQQQQEKEQEQDDDAAADGLSSRMQGIQLEKEAAAEAAAVTAVAPGSRQYSRDEVAQMMAQGQLTGELAVGYGHRRVTLSCVFNALQLSGDACTFRAVDMWLEHSIDVSALQLCTLPDYSACELHCHCPSQFACYCVSLLQMSLQRCGPVQQGKRSTLCRPVAEHPMLLNAEHSMFVCLHLVSLYCCPADELAALWSSAAGEAQRQCRLLCLAASAGDLQQTQVGWLLGLGVLVWG
jgi:hypothetical protein